MPIRASRRPTCCCRSACRSWCRSRTRRSRPPSTCRSCAADRAASPALRHAAHAQPARRTCCRTARYAVMVTNAGGGYSRRQHLAMTRWREDITTDAWGSFFYVRDLDSGEVWSTTHQPTRPRGGGLRGDVRARPRRLAPRRSGLETRTEIVVSPEDDAELRRVSMTNHSHRAAQPRADELCRGRPGAGRRRPGASGVQQPLRRDHARFPSGTR